MEAALIRVVGERATLELGGRELELPVERLARALAGAVDRAPCCGVLPSGVRLWIERGGFVGVAIELPPQVRTVRWLRERSRSPFGSGARYATHRLAFPFIVLLVVFERGCPTGLHQLYYRTRPLEADQQLLLPKLYNVVPRPGLPCWLCLDFALALEEHGWPGWVARLSDSVFSSPYNRSGEAHEGSSYWTLQPRLDPRLETAESWAEATKKDPLFPLSVPWMQAGTTAQDELLRMLDRASGSPAAPRSAFELAQLLVRGGWLAGST